MKIAVASDNGEQIAAHTGRCQGFVIYEVEGQQAQRVEFRRNTFTAHAQGECAQGAEHAHGASHHSHGALLAAIADCCVLVTRGLGPRLVADLATNGVDAYVCDVAEVDAAAGLYAQGRLPRVSRPNCGCHG